MQVFAICLGLLSCIYVSECAVTGWAAPTVGATGDFDHGAFYLNEGATTIITVTATTDATLGNYAIESQSTADFFQIATATSGAVTLKGANVLDGDASTLTHTVKISQTDSGTAVGTVTITFSIINGQFTAGYTCIYIGPSLAAAGGVITNAMSTEGGANAITISSGNTNTDFTVVATTGVITTANALTPASGTSGSYTLTLNGVESIGGTASTVQSTIGICMRGSTCVCTSAATILTAGLLVMLLSAIMMLLK